LSDERHGGGQSCLRIAQDRVRRHLHQLDDKQVEDDEAQEWSREVRGMRIAPERSTCKGRQSEKPEDFGGRQDAARWR
jgi:hypothetical protein